MSQENVEVVSRFVDALVQGDMEAVLAEVGSNVEIDDHDISLDTDHYRGHDGFLKWLSVWNDSWESWRLEDVENSPVGEEQVLSTFVMVATGRGSGVELARADAVIQRLHEGKIVEIAYYNDQQQAREAVGLRE